MSTKNTFWWFLLAIWSVGSIWWHTCKIKLLCDDPIVSQTIAPEIVVHVPNLSIHDGTNLSLNSNRNIIFTKTNLTPNFSLVQKEIDSLEKYLASNPDRKVTIAGHYHADEVNQSTWPNLGIARAENVKSYFVGKGISADRFETKGILDDQITYQRDTLFGSIDFSFDGIKAPATTDIFKVLDLYFNTGSDEYIKNVDNQKFIQSAKAYLAENKDKRLLLTGHTDNVGQDKLNEILSLKRAERVKSTLVKVGLPAEQLLVDSKGSKEPKSSNESAEGRAENRRVSIIVK